MNKFRENIEIMPEAEEDLGIRIKPAAAPSSAASEEKNLLTTFFREGVVSKETATEMLPFLIFLAFIGMIYIANSHFAVRNMRNIDKLSKEVKELSWEYKSLKADLMFRSKLTEVAKTVDTLGIKELVEPPKKIVINENEH
ncbi:FtsL-like putative cell division protein [Pedobacter sp. SYP-B3415]|uniref:FtsL-like putative cell division protein n=1 Tax=Pedobacter sp. SYP-B3415 TaxID=2496641 RepID=UPI00101C40BF|nr:FtsL-like putative cell division protein [Pedobacter sp. SYP-B3415]